MRGIRVFLALWIISTASVYAGGLKETAFEFYGQEIHVPYEEISLPQGPFSAETPEKFDRLIKTSDYKPTINVLLGYRSSLVLNDWLYYQLIKKTVKEAYPSASAVNQSLAEWFFLAKSGYRVRLMYDAKKPYIFVNTPDELLDAPFFLTKEGRYINLSAINTPDAKKLQKLTFTELGYDPKGRPFVFSFTEMPKVLADEEIVRSLRFEHEGKVYSLEANGNKSYITFLRSYPRLDLSYLPSLPVSEGAYQSVIPTFREWISGMDEASAVRLILSFTRSAFAYETDREAYHEESFAFSPEMTLLSPFSDCEDRAILFAWMVKELLGREVVLIEFPTHVATAVNLETTYGTPIILEGKQYSFCEATGPQDELGLGECDKRYVNVGYRVVRVD